MIIRSVGQGEATGKGVKPGRLEGTCVSGCGYKLWTSEGFRRSLRKLPQNGVSRKPTLKKAEVAVLADRTCRRLTCVFPPIHMLKS